MLVLLLYFFKKLYIYHLKYLSCNTFYMWPLVTWGLLVTQDIALFWFGGSIAVLQNNHFSTLKWHLVILNISYTQGRHCSTYSRLFCLHIGSTDAYNWYEPSTIRCTWSHYATEGWRQGIYLCVHFSRGIALWISTAFWLGLGVFLIAWWPSLATLWLASQRILKCTCWISFS